MATGLQGFKLPELDIVMAKTQGAHMADARGKQG